MPRYTVEVSRVDHGSQCAGFSRISEALAAVYVAAFALGGHDAVCALHGFLDRDLTLRDAIQAAHRDMPAASESRGTYPSDSRPESARWFSVESEEWETGDNVTYSIHFPDNTMPASRARLCRVLGARL